MDTEFRPELQIQVVEPTRVIPNLMQDVMAGLFANKKQLPPKYFYDDRGSELFDRICDEPEYYPTRTEDRLLRQSAEQIIARSRPKQILEFGSGTSRKTVHLLNACEKLGCHARYIPFDVCDDIVIKSGHRLQENYDWLNITPIHGDYTAGLDNLPVSAGPNLFLFLGGTIGNFTDTQGLEFLTDVRNLMSDQDWLLIGADRVKQPSRLHAAYNDAAGLTAEFNLNLLEVLNREIGSTFDKDRFAHYAFYNPDANQIEMYLMSMADQRIAARDLDRDIELEEGEAILTEISRKFTKPSLEHLLENAGFSVQEHFEAQDNPFSLVLAKPSS